MRNNLINIDDNNKSIFNNTSNQFYTRLKQIIPSEETNKINNYMTKDFSCLNNNNDKNINKSFISSNIISKCEINQYQLNKSNNFNFNNNYININKNKNKKNNKNNSITNLSNNNLYFNKSRDYSLLNKNTQPKEKIQKKY